MAKPIFISIPHSGEQVPPEAPWLTGLPESVLMCDVDRYVHELYAPAILENKLPAIIAEWHRYVVDLNRLPDDIDQDSVLDSANAPGTFTTGLHWSKTTTGIALMPKPISREQHDAIVSKCYEPFHHKVREMYQKMKTEGGDAKVYHIDAHSMPSKGTAAHRDPGANRPQIVVSDFDGRSCEPRFKDLVIQSYKDAGFEVGYNWPYKGGRITQTYGKPEDGQHALQVELNRSLYMDETSKHRLGAPFEDTQRRIKIAVTAIIDQL